MYVQKQSKQMQIHDLQQYVLPNRDKKIAKYLAAVDSNVLWITMKDTKF